MANTIALLCHSRTAYLPKVLSALALSEGLIDYDLCIFIDGPRSHSETEAVENVRKVIASYLPFLRSKSIALHQSPFNMGVWESKIRALKACYEAGADVVLLLEDDVTIAPDALIFVNEASAYVHSLHDHLITVSLYSHHLNKAKKLTYTRAFEYLAPDLGIASRWGCRKWPFPWGVALTRDSFHKLIDNGWNGNDQKMGMILQSLNGYDIYPILTRSEHIGAFSSTNQKNIIVEHHEIPPFKPVESFDISEDIHPDAACKTAALYQVNLESDQGIKDNIIKLYYRDPAELKYVVALYGPFYHIIESRVGNNVSSDNDKELKALMSRTECKNIVICLGDKDLASSLARHAKSICTVRIVDPSSRFA
jgi:GR25 family glycosyltransferase involved in LPS biosynthesis